MFKTSQLKELDLLVNSGLGAACIAPSLSALLCNIVGAEAGGLSWFGATGKPEGFYQRGSTREAELLFMNRYEELFSGPDEYTPFWALRNQGRGIIHPGQASQAYLRSNTYNMLVKPSHCRYLLCVLVDVGGMPRMAGCLFRAHKNPFTDADAKRLTALIPVLRRAVETRADALTMRGTGAASRAGGATGATGGHMLVSNDGGQVEMIDLPAEQLLNTIKLFDQNIALSSAHAAPPRFIKQLCEQLQHQHLASATTEIALAGGMLLVTAHQMSQAQDTTPQLPRTLAAGSTCPNKKILVSLQFRPSGVIEVVQGIAAMGLTPTQSRIAMYAAAGGSRTECAAQHRVSKEALKKHLREIYAASRCADWQELRAVLQNAAGF